MPPNPDTANTIIRPPVGLALAFVLGVALDWLYPLPFLPLAATLRIALGVVIVALGFVLAGWAIATMSKGGSNVPTNRPTLAIVAAGPYRFTRNPIYVGMFLLLVGVAVAFNTLWLVAALVIFALVIRYGVVAREEVYLEAKFANAYLDYKARVRRWL